MCVNYEGGCRAGGFRVTAQVRCPSRPACGVRWGRGGPFPALAAGGAAARAASGAGLWGRLGGRALLGARGESPRAPRAPSAGASRCPARSAPPGLPSRLPRALLLRRTPAHGDGGEPGPRRAGRGPLCGTEPRWNPRSREALGDGLGVGHDCSVLKRGSSGDRPASKLAGAGERPRPLGGDVGQDLPSRVRLPRCAGESPDCR